MIRIANPIYDSVFKFLVEDERIARTLLSALLKKEVLEVHARRHEYADETRNSLSMFRIDFAAKVQEADGSSHLVLIELQKTWLETETLRFRRYLGVQYGNKENIPTKDNSKGFAIPMVAVYLLGHRVGDIDEPVIYVQHKAYDYDGAVVTRGLPDPFVESLTHDSIIVQIPLLRGQVNNRLERVLSVFDQTAIDGSDQHVLELDEDKYAGDADMRYMLRRLTAASCNAEIRQNMNVEDEFYSAIENRDTAIMQLQQKTKEQRNRLKEQSNRLEEQSNRLEEQRSRLAEQDQMLRAMVNNLVQQGLTVSAIAKMIGRDEDYVKALL